MRVGGLMTFAPFFGNSSALPTRIKMGFRRCSRRCSIRLCPLAGDYRGSRWMVMELGEVMVGLLMG